jgi:hypothetical protein
MALSPGDVKRSQRDKERCDFSESFLISLENDPAPLNLRSQNLQIARWAVELSV